MTCSLCLLILWMHLRWLTGRKRRVNCNFTVAFIAASIKCTHVLFLISLGCCHIKRKSCQHIYGCNEKNPTLQNNPKLIPPRFVKKEPKRMSSPQSSGSRKVSGKEACDEDWSCASTGLTLGMGEEVDSFPSASPQILGSDPVILFEDSCIYKF